MPSDVCLSAARRNVKPPVSDRPRGPCRLQRLARLARTKFFADPIYEELHSSAPRANVDVSAPLVGCGSMLIPPTYYRRRWRAL